MLPDEVESLQLEPGRDLVTLVTCAPPTINTHRLLVHGEHLEPEASDPQRLVNLDGTAVGFPWWALWVGGSAVGLAVVIWLLRRPPARTRERGDGPDPA